MPKDNPEGYLNPNSQAARDKRANEKRAKQAQGGFKLNLGGVKAMMNVAPGGLIDKVNKKLKGL